MSPRTIVALIVAALVLWGLYIAGGVFWYGLNPLGAVVVLVCEGLFLGFWLLLLSTQRRNRQN